MSLLFALPSRGSGDTASAGRDYLIDVWQTEDGLPQNTVTSILQTRSGYLWIGTFGGLARFDGVRFTTFGVDEKGLRSNRILCLHEDHSENLWIGTEGGGLVRYRNGQFTNFTTKEGLLHDVVTAIAEDVEGNLWVGTRAGVCQWSQRGFVSYTEQDGLPSKHVTGIHLGRSGRLWVTTLKGLCFLKDKKFVPHLEQELAARSPVYGCFEDHAGSLWIYGEGFLVCSKQGKIEDYSTRCGSDPRPILAMIEGANKDIWIGGRVLGVNRFREGSFTAFTAKEGLSHQDVRALYEDREGNLWVGTVGGGLNRLKPKRVTLYTSFDGLANEVVTSLGEAPGGELWVGCNCGGLYRWQNGRFELFGQQATLFGNGCIWPICVGRKGPLWIGTWGEGLFRFENGSSIHYGPREGLSDDAVLALCEDTSGGLWIGTYQGGLDYLEGQQFTHYTQSDGLSGKYLTSILQARDGSLWIGSNGGGLNHKVGKTFTVFKTKDGLASNFIRTLYEDNEGCIWIGTGGGGLSRYYKGEISHFTTKNGLFDDVISQIMEDDAQNLWLGSNRGILRVKKEELSAFAEGKIKSIQCLSYGKEEGLLNLECTGGFHPAGLRSRDGKLWFSTVKGLALIEPGRLPGNQVAPPVIIEQMIVDGKEVGEGNWQFAEAAFSAHDSRPKIVVPAQSKRIEFQYTALSLVAAEKARFKFQLEGLDPDWVDAGTRRTAYYSYVPPGSYRFRVIACNNDGLWNELGSAVAITIPPPFWRTWWFILCGGLVSAVTVGRVVYSVMLAQLRRKLERLEQQNALVDERARIAQDIHDDLGASLTQICLLGELAKRDSVSEEEAKAHIAKMTEKTRDLVRSLDEIVWAVNPQNDSVTQLATYICQFAQEFLRLTPVRCRLDVKEGLPAYPLATDVRHGVFLVAKEALHNVVKHAAASEVWLRIAMRGSVFSLTLEDNGCGFAIAQADSSRNGLRNMQHRIQEIGGQLEIASQPSRGTTVKVRVSLKQASWHNGRSLI